jgi:hypothetical protein
MKYRSFNTETLKKKQIHKQYIKISMELFAACSN